MSYYLPPPYKPVLCTGAVDIMSAAQKYMFMSFHKTSRLDGGLKRNIHSMVLFTTKHQIKLLKTKKKTLLWFHKEQKKKQFISVT